MIAVKAGTLRVPGASLHYEVRGSGPILLLIHPAGGDARAFEAIANDLAGRYTAVAAGNVHRGVPGGHVGYRSHPRAFADRLREVLGAPPGRRMP